MNLGLHGCLFSELSFTFELNMSMMPLLGWPHNRGIIDFTRADLGLSFYSVVRRL